MRFIMMYRGGLFLAVLLLLCARESSASSAPPPPEALATEAGAVPPTWEEAANARYAGPMGMAFELVQGEWSGQPYVEGGASAPRAGLARGFLLTGDLDADGVAESIVLLWTSSGGSGTLDYLAVVERRPDGTVAERASVELGDRVHIRAARIEAGQVVLDTVQAGPGDALCCPGQRMRRVFALEGDVMTEVSTEDRGRLSLADLDGDWVLLELGREALPENVRITARFDNGTLTGTAACNAYNGRVKAGDAPGDLALAGPLAVTRKMCPPPLMEWEQRYLRALAGLSKFSFTAGKLVLTATGEEGPQTLRFGTAKPAMPAAGE
jgi:heat shock protein HslJ